MSDGAKELKAFSIKLGRALQKRNGPPYGPANHRLNRSEDGHSKQKLWSVSSVPVSPSGPARLLWNKENLSEQVAPPLSEA